MHQSSQRVSSSKLWAFVFGLLTQFWAACAPEKVKPIEPLASTPAQDHAAASSNKCASLRSGTVLGDAEKKAFAPVGMLGIPSVVAGTPPAHLCGATLIRPNVAITAQLFCVSNLDLTDSANANNMVFALDPAVPATQRKVKQIIRWREDSATFRNFRDVALLVLDAPYDETMVYFDMKQGVIPDALQQKVSLVGSGGYVNGTDLATYSLGSKRFGEMMVNGKINANIGQFANGTYDPDSDYVRIDPITATSPINCDRDNGAPGLALMGYSSIMMGFATGNVTTGATNAERCVNATLGVLVPSYDIQTWLDKTLPMINPTDINPRRTLLEGTIQSIQTSGADRILTVKQDLLVDDGLGLAIDTYSIRQCLVGCSPVSRATAKVEVGKRLVFSVIKAADQKLQAATIDATTLTPVYKVQFNANITSVESQAKSNYGRMERIIQANYVTAEATSGPVPLAGDKAMGIFCDAGCTKASLVGTDGFTPAAGKGVSIQGDVYQGRLYIRSLSQNPDFDLERLLPKPTPITPQDNNGLSQGKGDSATSGCSAP